MLCLIYMWTVEFESPLVEKEVMSLVKKRKLNEMKKSVKMPQDVFKSAKTTGDLIKAFRANFEVKQDDMAHACQISQANLSAIEQNRRKIGPSVALRLAAFMGLSPDLVLYPSGFEAEPEYQEVRERVRAYNAIVAKRRK